MLRSSPACLEDNCRRDRPARVFLEHLFYFAHIAPHLWAGRWAWEECHRHVNNECSVTEAMRLMCGAQHLGHSRCSSGYDGPRPHSAPCPWSGSKADPWWWGQALWTQAFHLQAQTPFWFWSQVSAALLCSMKRENLLGGALWKQTWLRPQYCVYGGQRVASFPCQTLSLELSSWIIGKALRACPKVKSCMVLRPESASPPRASDWTESPVQECQEAGSNVKHLSSEAPPY